MNQPIKTVLPDNIKKLLHEGENTLRPLKNSIEAAYKAADVALDPIAAAIVSHIDALQSVFIVVEDCLETPSLKRFVGGVLHKALMLNLSYSNLCSVANEAQVIPLDRPLYRYEDGGAILEAINAAQVLNDVIADLREAI